MPRLMSVSLTEPQVRARAKTVTRRAGWLMLRPGDRLTLCRKVMGRRKGEPLDRITDVAVTSVRRERLDAITAADVAAEGFPDWTPVFPMPNRWQIRPLGAWTDSVTGSRRGAHLFKASWDATLDLLLREADYLDVTGPIVVQVDVQQADLRVDGMLKARARPGFPGVVISFASRFGPLRYATDAYERWYGYGMDGWQANVRAIALALEALRAVDRYGVTRRGEQYQGWTALPAAHAQGSKHFADAAEALAWMKRCAEGKASDDPKAMYKLLGRTMHPDTPEGNAELWERLDAAAALLGLRSTDG